MIISDPPQRGSAVQRFGQLTYSSFDDGVTGGGWQIKEHRGDLTDDEREWLRSRVAIQFDPGVELPRFPTPEQAAALARRFVYAPAEGGAAGCWHTAPAGVDGSGRPGNVFAHVVLDRTPLAEVVDVRPIDLWRSPDWLTPYGVDQVNAARLPEIAHPGPGSAVTTSEVVRFLLDPDHFRFGVFAALLDACAAALAGGPRVALLTSTVDEAALWIGAVSHLMASVTARRFFFSTLERASGLESAWNQGVHLACLPIADLETFGRPDPSVVIINGEEENVLMGDLDGAPHRTASGHEVAVTEWSVMAQVVLAEPQGAQWALEQIDDVVGRVGDAGTDPAWPLAMVISQAQDHFGDAVQEAARVIARATPKALGRQPELFSSARLLVDVDLGATTADVWKHLTGLVGRDRPLTLMGELCLGVYAARALRDTAWLSQPGSVPLPEIESFGDHYQDEASAAAAETLARLERAGDSPESLELPAAIAGLADLVARLGIVDPLRDRLEVAIERWVLPLLFDDANAAAHVRRLGPLAEITQDTLVRHVVSTHQQMVARWPGRRLVPEVVAWLYPDGAGPMGDQQVLRSELAFQRVFNDRPGQWPPERPVAFWAALEHAAAGGAMPQDLSPFFVGDPWSPMELLGAERKYGSIIPTRHLAPTFKSAPWDRQLDELTRAVLSTRFRSWDRQITAADAELALVKMRHVGSDAWWQKSGVGLTSSVQQVLAGGVAGLSFPDVEFSPDAYDMLHVAYAIAVVVGTNRVEVSQLRDVVVGDGRTDVSENAHRMMLEGLKNVTKLHQLTLAYLLGEPKYPGPSQGPTYRWLEQLKITRDGVRMPVLASCLRDYLAVSAIPQEVLTGQVIQRLTPMIRRSDNNTDRVVRACERFVQTKIRDLYPSEGLIQRLRSRGQRD